MELAVGNPVPRPVRPSAVTPLTHPDAQRRSACWTTSNNCARHWTTVGKVDCFPAPKPTPDYRKELKGRVRYGLAGTGKSVVAFTRGRARAPVPNSRVLLTTFLDAGRASRAESRPTAWGRPLGAWADRSWSTYTRSHAICGLDHESMQLNIISGKPLMSLVDEANATVGNGAFSSAFLRAEWETLLIHRASAPAEEYQNA